MALLLDYCSGISLYIESIIADNLGQSILQIYLQVYKVWYPESEWRWSLTIPPFG